MTFTPSPRSVRLAATLAFMVTAAGCAPPPGSPGALAQPRTGPAAPVAAVANPADPPRADVEVNLDRAALTARGVDPAAVGDALAAFFEAYPFFSLSDLNDVKVKAADGRQVALKDVATVDVWFAVARTQIVVGGKK